MRPPISESEAEARSRALAGIISETPSFEERARNIESAEPPRPERPALDPATVDRATELGVAASTLFQDLIRRGRNDINAFIEFVITDPSGEPLRQAALHRVWQRHIDFCWSKKLIPAVISMFGHGKSTNLTIGRTCFELGRNPEIRTKIIGQADERAMERVMGISNLISKPRYRLLFPEVREVPQEKRKKERAASRWTQHEIYLDRAGFAIDPSVQAAGVISSGTGGRCDLIIFDDVVDQRNAIDEPALRDKVANNIDNVWMQRLEPTGRALYVGTHWHDDDYSYRILDRPGWCVLRQMISEDFQRIEQEVFGAPEDYPIPRAASRTTVVENLNVADTSSNIANATYDPSSKLLEIEFKSGGRYVYLDVPVDTYAAFAASTSKGSFFAQVIRGRYEHRKLAAKPAALNLEVQT